MRKKEITGGKRLQTMIDRKLINDAWLWIDTYNQCVGYIAGTIKARIDANCMYFVSVIEDEHNPVIEHSSCKGEQ